MRPRFSILHLLFATLAVALLATSAKPQEAGFLGKPLNKWVEELGSKDPGVRRSAAFALGKMGSTAVYAVPKLARVLKDKNANVREAAATALGEIGPTAWEGTLPGLIDLLSGDSDPQVKRSAAMALGQLGKQLALTEEEPMNQVRVALEKSLADPQASVRQN